MGLLAFTSVAAPAAARVTGGGLPPPGTGVLDTPATGTPSFVPGDDNPVEQIRQLVKCGNLIYAVGSFSQIVQGGQLYDRSNAFSFSATPPFTVTSWAPAIKGKVDSIAFRPGHCTNAYIGGAFNSVNGKRAKDIAKLDASTGALVSAFAHHASAEVETLRAIRAHLLVGGFYTSINHSAADPYMTSLNPRTGKNDGFVHLRIKGPYKFPKVVGNHTRVYNQQLSHSGKLDLVEGDFTSVGGRPRQQIFMLNVSGSSAKVTGWRSPEFDGYCSPNKPFYIQGASWSPNDSTVYLASTGFHPYDEPTGTHPRTGLCDSASAFPARQTSVRHRWINYTGCDSLYSSAADASTVYFGGHQRWSMNRLGCNFQGTGAYPDAGLEGVSPSSGALYLDPAGTAGYYERSRGYGADDMLLTDAGLWIASDNAYGSQTCGGVSGLSGICFLPYPPQP